MEKADLFTMTFSDYYDWQHPVPKHAAESETMPDGFLAEPSREEERACSYSDFLPSDGCEMAYAPF